MAAAGMMDYNPAQVMFNARGRNPYLFSGTPAMLKVGDDSSSTTPQSTTLGAEAVRSTGTGPFDASYRQNLATYAGGNFIRPGGSLSFNPTDPNALMGSPTGGGTAPVQGIGTSLIQQAIGGQPFSAQTPPPAAPSVSPQAAWKNNWRFWLKQFNDNGNLFRGMSQ